MVADTEALIGWAPIPKEVVLRAERVRFVAWLHAGAINSIFGCSPNAEFESRMSLAQTTSVWPTTRWP